MFKALLSKFKKPTASTDAKLPSPLAPLPLPDVIDPDLLAYDLTLRPDADPSHPCVTGWCFGLPRGITSEQ